MPPQILTLGLTLYYLSHVPSYRLARFWIVVQIRQELRGGCQVLCACTQIRQGTTIRLAYAQLLSLEKRILCLSI